ncbi:MAG: SprB repeat-containing protein, partial [Bacteroidales bacterium]|nr:SprB repeat-containing protein [Bacteroidales bacterium]
MENFTHNNSIFKTKIGYKIRFIIFTGIFLFVNLILTAQIVPTIQPYGGFEIDGDLKANTPTNGIGDWLSNTGSGGYLLNNNGTPLDPFNTLYIIDDFNGNDDIYQSSKFNENPNTWVWTTGAASNKNDINKTLFHLATDVNNNTWLIVASDRLSTSGTSYIDFEFLQNTLAKNQNGTFTSFGPHNGRTVNDFVISMEYSNGGSSGIVRFYTWKLVNSVYKYIEVTVPSNIAFAKTNLNTIPVDFGAFGSNQYVPYQFVEAAINITALFGTFDPCLGLNIKTIMVKTKASTSETASLGDFVNPIQTQLNINSATISYANNLCNTGTASVNINGVQGGTFSAVPNNLIINPVTGEIDLTNSAPGSYTITYTYTTNNCNKTTSANVTINPLPTAPTSITASDNNICQTYNQPITLTANGGSGTTLAWYLGSCGDTLIGTGNSITISPPTSTTTYYVRWENSCGVSACLSLTLNVFNSLTVNVISSPQVSCYSGNDGQIIVSVNGGTSPFVYSLNGGTAQSSNTFSGLTAGTYTVVVSDANGCSYTLNNIIIANPTQLTATANASSQVSCNNAADGYITINAQGGTGAYSYSLNGGTAQSSNTFSGLTAGTYTVVVSDANGCSYTLNNILISNPSQLTATANASSQVSCNNAADGYITITAQGGTGAYSYSLNGGTAQNSNTFTGLTAGTYTVVVSDANGCSYTLNNILISNPSQLTATANASSQVSCNNAADGYITITAQGGTGAYSYSLNGSTAQSSNTFNGLTAGTYTVVVSDANGCSYTLNNIIIANPDQLTATANASSQVSCNNAADGQITITAQGGTGAYSYSLNGGTAQSSNTFSG